MEVTHGREFMIEVEVDGTKHLRPFVVPAGVMHLTVCLNHGRRELKAGAALLIGIDPRRRQGGSN
jgi:hypothetical protein